MKVVLLLWQSMRKEGNRAHISLLIIAFDSWICTNAVQTPDLLQLASYSIEHMEETSQKSIIRYTRSRENVRTFESMQLAGLTVQDFFIIRII